jgi:hypothetical protein
VAVREPGQDGHSSATPALSLVRGHLQALSDGAGGGAGRCSAATGP